MRQHHYCECHMRLLVQKKHATQAVENGKWTVRDWKGATVLKEEP